jgi:hypothetical protein
MAKVVDCRALKFAKIGEKILSYAGHHPCRQQNICDDLSLQYDATMMHILQELNAIKHYYPL